MSFGQELNIFENSTVQYKKKDFDVMSISLRYFQSPAEKVVLLCSKNTDGDIDNILANIDTEEFHVDVKRKDRTDGNMGILAEFHNSPI